MEWITGYALEAWTWTAQWQLPLNAEFYISHISRELINAAVEVQRFHIIAYDRVVLNFYLVAHRKCVIYKIPETYIFH
jgi:hypothetical protein